MPHWRRKRREPTPWEQDPANPDMLVYTRFTVVDAIGTATKVEMDLAPQHMQSLARESLYNAETDRSKPNWDRDPLYHAARRLRKRRQSNQNATNPPTKR